MTSKLENQSNFPTKEQNFLEKLSSRLSTTKSGQKPTPMSLTTIFAVILVLSPLATSSLTDDKPTAYEILAGYNFPIGILPKGATGYELDPTTGKFGAFLNGSCSFSLEGSYQLKYKSIISGYISENRITNLSGITVKVLFFWLNIVEVTRKGDELEFYVGIASASFPIDNFYECPQCGCGLDCNNWQISKLRTNPFVSSF